MKALVADVENTVSDIAKGKLDLTPYNPANKLVSIGWCMVDVDSGSIGPVEYRFLNHSTHAADNMDAWYAAVEECDFIVAHNAKYDAQWLLETGLVKDKDKPFCCTMVREYVLRRGTKEYNLNLAELAQRYGAPAKRTDLAKEYLDKGVTFYDIPADIVEEYGREDVLGCADIFVKQNARLQEPENVGLIPTCDMMCEFITPLVEMERNGVKIDMAALDKVAEEYEAEKEQLETAMQDAVYDVMGDKPVALSSPEQLSTVIYSRRMKDKTTWKAKFNIGLDERGKALRRPKMSKQDFKQAVVDGTETVYRTKVRHCPECGGSGRRKKYGKTGVAHKKDYNCLLCLGSGVQYDNTNVIAGFKCQPQDYYWPSSLGFSTSKGELEELLLVARQKKQDNVVQFLTKAIRLSAVEVYLSSFVGGIRVYRQKHDDVLHVNFNMHITATGRLSSSNPNFQNQPRGNTFPVRRCFISRWADIGGQVADVDFSQLEFRAAGHLCLDPNVKRDVEAGIDVHVQTRDTITNAGQSIDRQAAKPHTFKPLYGGMSGTDAEVAYYRAFLRDYYPTIGRTHLTWHEMVLKDKMITLPTGRQYAFPNVFRNQWGKASQGTQIVNYPVQGFATADIVPCAIIALYKAMQENNLKSKMVLTVHDSISIDTHPDEVDIVTSLCSQLATMAERELTQRYGIRMFVPLACETKIGSNLLEMKKVA